MSRLLDPPPLIVEGSSTEDRTERNRALRTFHVALGGIAATPVDVFVGPSDSIGAGAYAGTFPAKFISVMQAKLRQGVQPSNVKGGAGYFPLGITPFLQGDGWLAGVTGGSSANTVDGLGRISLNLNSGSQLALYFRGTSLDMLYKQVAGAGSFTVTIDGGAPVGPTSAAGSTDHLKTTIATGLTSGVHLAVIDITVGTVTIEGMMAFDQDETKGLRVWSGAHSGYGASDYISSTVWEDSLDNIPSCKLVVLPIGSNDWYNGRTAADTKADIETIIGVLETKFGADVSIALVSYYDRPEGVTNIPWDQWRDLVYKPIADAADNVTWVALDALFGPLLSDTDDRGGLTTASPGDYVHPTPAGHALIGEFLSDFLLPQGLQGAGAVFNNTPDSLKPVSTPQAIADLYSAYGGMNVIDGGSFAGAMTFGALYPCVYQVVATGNLTLSTASMPPVAAGRAAHHFIQITQDGTGSRTLTHGSGFKFRQGVFPALQTAAASVDLIHYYWDGDFWWVENYTAAVTKAYVDAGDQAASDTGDKGVVSATINSFSGAMSLAAFTPILGRILNINLVGNATFNITGIPAVPTSRGGSFYIRFNQDATGSRTLTLTGFKRAGGAFALSTAGSASDLIRFFYDGTNWWAIPVALNGS